MELVKTEALLKAMLAADSFDAYAVAVGVDGKETCLTSPGVGGDTYFDAASMGKVLVTATLILKLVTEGRLSLDDTLERFFDGVPEDKKAITVKHLLTHTSGILRFGGEIPPWYVDSGRDAVADYLMSQPLPYPVGSAYAYSCYGYILLGFIAEKVYGVPLDEAFYRYVKTPLGLTRARFNLDDTEKDYVKCWRRKYRGAYEVDDEAVYSLAGVAGNAGSFWTLDDMRRYVKAVLRKDERLYGKELFALAEKNHTPDMAEGRGLGWLVVNAAYPQTGKLFPVGSFGHCGHTGQSFFINREKQMYAIVLTNATRHSRAKNGDNYYQPVMKMREEIHNAVYDDLTAQKMI